MRFTAAFIFLAVAAVTGYVSGDEDSMRIEPRGLFGGLARRVLSVPKAVLSVPSTIIGFLFGSREHLEQFQKECLDKHNTYRSLHGVGKLVLDYGLSEYAQKRAEELARSKTMIHQSRTRFGENTWMMRSSDPNPKVHGGDPVETWYRDELPNFPFGAEPSSSNLNAGHLTQVLWANSKRLGVGVAKNGDYIAVVCNYDPAGNVAGQFADNVPAVGGRKVVYTPTTTRTTTTTTTKSAPKPKPAPAKPAKSSDEDDDSFSTTTDDEYVTALVDSQNEKRALHGVPALTYNSKIAEAAQEWADQLAEEDSLKTQKGSKYGQNIFWSNVDKDSADVIKSWYDEVEHYKDFEAEPDMATFAKVGHFTQMTWKKTSEVGCGKSTDKAGAIRVVCFYSPKGNYMGQFVDNVKAPQ